MDCFVQSPYVSYPKAFAKPTRVVFIVFKFSTRGAMGTTKPKYTLFIHAPSVYFHQARRIGPKQKSADFLIGIDAR